MGTGVKRTSVKNSFGFTIVETLIVLAVTGLLMLSIIALINGRQQATAFQTALNSVRTEMQQVSSDVVNGAFPDTVGFGCTGSNTIQLSAAANNDGRCTFIGKAVHFRQQTDGSDDNYSVYSMVGLKNDATTYGPSGPTGVAPYLAAKTSVVSTQNPGNAVGDNITTGVRLQNGLSVRKMTYSSSSTPETQISSFAFMQSLNPGLADTTSGGNQHSVVMALYGASGSLTNDQDTEATAIDTALRNNTFSTDPSVVINVCLRSGTTSQWALLTITSSDIRTQVVGACA